MTTSAWLRASLCAAGIFFFTDISSTEAASSKDAVDFSSQIRPIISAKCFHCHGPDEASRKAKLRLDIREEATSERDGKTVIKPGDPARSELIRRITTTDADDLMPPAKAGHPLTNEEIKLLEKWVKQGAPYTGHWAFTKPQWPAPPKVKLRSWPKNPLDLHILARLEENALKPSPPADRFTLIRRLSLDITGLPPTAAEVSSFLHDKSPDAYEKVVDHLLASPAYGEKWTRLWLDIARYADSFGYGHDAMRPNAPWLYRDWLIQALNSNVPYDQFTIQQLAGDLVKGAREEDNIATAFHRNTMTNVEGGTDDEEFRLAAVKDRVNVTMQTWMGLTMGCAQCHTHKFDPITQKEYYQFLAFFNQTEDNDQPDEGPTMSVPSKEERARMDKLKGEIASLRGNISINSPALVTEFADWEKAHRDANQWTVLESIDSKSTNGTTFTKLSDGSLLASTNAPEKDSFTVKTILKVTNATALRLEVMSDDTLPSRGPGRAPNGNFVLNELRVSVKPTSTEPKRVRFVRLELPGEKRMVSLAEVQVFSQGTNVALKAKASQSTVEHNAPAELAIDGNTNGHFYEGRSVTHTSVEDNPWWEVDLGEEKVIDSIVLWNRTDENLGYRLANFHLVALDEKRSTQWSTHGFDAPTPTSTLTLAGERTVLFKRATATHNQGGFEVTKLIPGSADATTGWAIAGGEGKNQIAILELAEPLPAGELTATLIQNYGGQHTLGRFRLSATDSGLPSLIAPANITSLLNKAGARSTQERQELLQWYQRYALATADINRQIEPLQRQLDGIKPMQLSVMRELAADKRRATHILNKGNHLVPGDKVSEGIPAAFNPWPVGAPTNRLGVAQWLMSAENPLTARVTANRIWGQIFGIGIVETEEDFGTQGALPTHPELLDWLALELAAPAAPAKSLPRYTAAFGDADGDRMGGNSKHSSDSVPVPWDLKRFIKTIVMSATYQQSSRVTPELLRKDPRNRLLSRAPRRRLEAETIRDQALAFSGLLSGKIGGPSVYPPQPDGLWKAAFDSTREYKASTGEDRYRRGIYTVWRRTTPNPSMTTFDAPSRETCTFRRLPTNTPLQAYVTLNDPVFVEAAQALGRRLVREGGATVDDKIRFGLQLVLGRPPEKAEFTELKSLYEFELAHYGNNPEAATKFATNPLGPLPEGISAVEAAAWTMIGNVLLNLDGALTKG